MICQKGEVVNVRDRSVLVKIMSTSSCPKCHAKAICSATGRQEKIINAISHEALDVGDFVLVKIEERMGRIAIFYGFFLPFILMVTVLFISYALGTTQIKAAVFALTGLFPYYICLYIFREKIEKDFIFLAEKVKE